MQQDTLDNSSPPTFLSPKRKRLDDFNDTDMVDISRSPLRLRIDLPSRPVAVTSHDHSPRTRMSNQMQDLRLQQEHHKSSNCKSISDGVAYHATKPQLPPLELPEPANNVGPFNIPELRTGLSSQLREVLETPQTSSTESSNTQPGLEQPRTPTLKPAPSPSSAPHIISPLPVSSTPALPLPPVSGPSPTPSPAKKRKSSPEPEELGSELVWSDSEITGHKPTDPQDDGYGINGIGFRPTPAIAAQRAMKRKQQVANWRTREAREARSRRAERRRNVEAVGLRAGAALTADGDGDGDGERRVRFLEG